MKLNFLMLSVFSFLESPLFAKNYQLNALGDQWLVIPSNYQIEIKPWDAEPKPLCNELFSVLSKNSATIDRCLPGGSQPQTACRLLKTILPKAIFGVDEPTISVAEDVEQFFSINSSSFEAVPDLTSISQTEGIPLSKLIMVTQSPWQSDTKEQLVKIVGSNSSYIPKLLQLDYLKDSIGQIAVAADGSYGVRDRVSYCELVSGSSSIVGQVKYKTQIVTPVSEDSIDWISGLYQKLGTLKYPLSGNIEQQALTIGYHIGQYSIENPLTLGDSQAPLEIFRTFFDNTNKEIRLKTLDNSDFRKYFSKKIETSVEVSFQSKN